MLTYCLRRLLGLFPVGFGVVAIVSLLIHIVPGDPVDVMLGAYATLEDKTRLRADLGLDAPIPVQIANYYRSLMTGDLGTSLIYREPVTSLIGRRIQPTIELAVCALVVALFISLPLGIYSSLRKGKWQDYSAMGFALLGICVPNFWLGPLLVLLFSLQLGWFPVSERGALSSYVLPSLTMGMALAAILSRMTRTSMLENMREDYVRTARAKGNPEPIVIGKHVLRNAALPLVTIVGLQFGVLLTGAIITERIFDWPGLGTLILEGIYNRDYPLVQGCVLMFSATYLLVNLATDILYGLVDPRIKLSR